jgi:hypothetical protein
MNSEKENDCPTLNIDRAHEERSLSLSLMQLQKEGAGVKQQLAMIATIARTTL